MRAYQVALAMLIALAVARAIPLEMAHPPSTPADEAKLLVITEDVIPDEMNSTQKVIRVNPVERPALKDDQENSMESALYKIQTLLPAHRTYTSSKRIRKTKTTALPDISESEHGQGSTNILRLAKPHPEKAISDKFDPKRKRLHFLYNQATLDGGAVLSKRMRVHVAPGGYPVYYMVAKTNGSMGKFPLKHFQSENEFVKYITKNKLASN